MSCYMLVLEVCQLWRCFVMSDHGGLQHWTNYWAIFMRMFSRTVHSQMLQKIQWQPYRLHLMKTQSSEDYSHHTACLWNVRFIYLWWNLKHSLQDSCMPHRSNSRTLFSNQRGRLMCTDFLTPAFMFGGSLVTIAWHVLGLRMEGRPPAMDGSCEYIE
jgi:hypothetical protein